MIAGAERLTVLYEYHVAPLSTSEAPMATLWFYTGFDSNGPAPSEDPMATKLVGPRSVGECMTVAKALKLALWKLGHDLTEEHTADD